MKKYKRSYKSNKFEISASTSNDKFELLKWSFSVSDIQNYFEHIINKHETVTDNPLIRKYLNKIEIRAIFKIKTWYYLELVAPETMKVIGSTKNKITKDTNGKCTIFRSHWSSIISPL